MRCLYCYRELTEGEQDFHAACSRKMFGTSRPPELPYTEAQMDDLARNVIKSQVAVTGVQPKLSVDVERAPRAGKHDAGKRFTIVGLWGSYILKPPTERFPALPELEDVTMHLAQAAGIDTVPHSLIRLQSGTLAYITKRIDRQKKKKLHMEDMCQLTERLTEDKYKGSYEQVTKAIVKYTANPGLDVINFCEQLVFSFLTGNADMHLKNFSLIKQPGMGYTLAPVYDMVASALLMTEDTEELALTLNGKKKKLQRKDFDSLLAATTIVDKKSMNSVFEKMAAAIPAWHELIALSFLAPELKEAYTKLINERAMRLNIL